jgi:dTDP-4-amino-4,6-dideoxygalactose transaminase
MTKVQTLKIRENTQWNFSYYPIILKDEATLLGVQKSLNEEGIFPRRYFYPSLNTISYIDNTSMPISENIASRILCLPLYVGLSEVELEKIVVIVNTF